MIIPMIRSKSRKTSFYSVFDMFDETSIVLEKEIFVLVKMKHTYCKEKERSKQTKRSNDTESAKTNRNARTQR